MARSRLPRASFDALLGLAATGIQLLQDALYQRLPHGARQLLALAAQALMALADRLHGPESRAHDAQVFAVVAEKR
jgi:hypothetical protein